MLLQEAPPQKTALAMRAEYELHLEKLRKKTFSLNDFAVSEVEQEIVDLQFLYPGNH